MFPPNLRDKAGFILPFSQLGSREQLPSLDHFFYSNHALPGENMLNKYTEISLKISMLLTEKKAHKCFYSSKQGKSSDEGSHGYVFFTEERLSLWPHCKGKKKKTEQIQTAETTEFFFWIATVDNSTNSSLNM